MSEEQTPAILITPIGRDAYLAGAVVQRGPALVKAFGSVREAVINHSSDRRVQDMLAQLKVFNREILDMGDLLEPATERWGSTANRCLAVYETAEQYLEAEAPEVAAIATAPRISQGNRRIASRSRRCEAAA